MCPASPSIGHLQLEPKIESTWYFQLDLLKLFRQKLREQDIGKTGEHSRMRQTRTSAKNSFKETRQTRQDTTAKCDNNQPIEKFSALHVAPVPNLEKSCTVRKEGLLLMQMVSPIAIDVVLLCGDRTMPCSLCDLNCIDIRIVCELGDTIRAEGAILDVVP